jgi:SAM-dependent methyltransferase
LAVSFTKLCNVEEFDNPQVEAQIKRIYPDFPLVWTRRKALESAVMYLALQDAGALKRDARCLVVGAGSERFPYTLTTELAEVHLTDLYMDAGVWANITPRDMLTTPEKFVPASLPWEPQRLVVQHMDARHLRYPDASFEIVLSSGSIEHFGTLEDIAQAASEMGRVLKPGGIAVLTTEFKISGNGVGWPGTYLFTPELLQQFIVAPSGLILDEPDLHLTPASLATEAQLDDLIAGRPVKYEVVIRQDPYLFCSVHLVLRKPAAATSAQASEPPAAPEDPPGYFLVHNV